MAQHLVGVMIIVYPGVLFQVDMWGGNATGGRYTIMVMVLSDVHIAQLRRYVLWRFRCVALTMVVTTRLRPTVRLMVCLDLLTDSDQCNGCTQ